MPDCWQELARFAVYSLAVLKVTHMLWQGSGPWDVIDWVRATAGVYYEYDPVAGKMVRMADTVLGKLFNCPLCLSIWLSALATGSLLLELRVLDIGALMLGMAGLVMVMLNTREND